MILLREIVDPSVLENSEELVTIVGAGGKTSTMFSLARELRSLGKRVLVTTTTAIYEPSAKEYDRLYTGDRKSLTKKIPNFHNSRNSGEITVWGSKTDHQGKLQGIKPEDIDAIFKAREFSWILVEGDGAKRKNIKAPKDHEPVIPSAATIVIGVIGMEVLGKPVDENSVHGIAPFIEVTGAKSGDKIEEEVLRRLIFHEKGLFKGAPPGAKRILLLNQCEDIEIRNRALAFAEDLSIPYLVTSLQKGKVYGAKK